MKNIAGFLLLFFCLSARAQSDIIINTTTLYIAEGKYDSAEIYLDSLLKADGRNIDALMMLGNVWLNNALMQTPALDPIGPDDESVYSGELAGLQQPTVLLPRNEAMRIDKIWKQCLDIDSGRLDILEGLCSVYGMAGLRDSLLAALPKTARAGSKKGDDFAYLIAQYAQLLADRGDREGAYAVYNKIASLYPKAAGIWCIMAESYQDAGDLTSARRCAEQGLNVQRPEMAACSDALDIYTALGEYGREIELLKSAWRDSLFPDYPFYNGVYKYATRQPHWQDDLKAYKAQFSSAPDSNAMYEAATFMLSKYFTDDYEGFVSLLRFGISDLYVALIAERGMSDYVDSVQPCLVAAEVLVHDHNYSRADSLLSRVATKNMDGDTKIDFQIQYAYTLYCSGKYRHSAEIWEELAKIDLPYLFATSNYFLGRCAMITGDKATASARFKALVESNDDSKFAYLAKLQLEKMAK